MRKGLMLAAALWIPAAAWGQCGAPTPRDSEGPFYKAGAPLRATLVEPGAAGERLVLSGRVLTRECTPVANATLDFWQTDERGEYDNHGFRYRGRVTTGADGRYRLESILPGLYPGRPRHIHVKVHAPGGGRVLTTQLYFREPRAGALAVKTEERDGVQYAVFDFVL